VPETGFTDLQFHDVGAARHPAERELGARAPLWAVNTPSLVGAFATPPYAGALAARDPESLVEQLVDARNPSRSSSHGFVSGLTNRQLRDLAELVGSIDGGLTAAQVRAAADVVPPRVARVAPTSLTRLEVWFSESVAPSAADPAAWRVVDAAGRDVPVTGGTYDAVNGDRITLALDRLLHGCSDATYRLIPAGPILDLADTVQGGRANALDPADPANSPSFTIGDTITVTLGASGAENLAVEVHDCATNPFTNNFAQGSVYLLRAAGGGQGNAAFVRFDWSQAFAAATGVTDPNDIVDASFTLQPFWGDASPVEARRVLQAWWDHRQPDLTQTPRDPISGHGGPTLRDSEWNVRAWNAPGAMGRAAGVEGRALGDYFGAQDTAFTPDAIADPVSAVERFVVGGPLVTDAFRFWLANPQADQGYSFRLLPGARQELKCRSTEEELGQFGPVLTITYRVPSTDVVPVREVSPRAAAQQLFVAKDPGGLLLAFEDLAAAASSYSVYEGTLTAWDGVSPWYSHAGLACAAAPALVASRRELTLTPTAGSRYYLVTAADACTEGPSGEDSFLAAHPPGLLDCAP
jgi:hypothetical protein